jgi:hypothetical protein
MVEPDRPQMTIWHKRIACWITKATNTQSEYVIINNFPLNARELEATDPLHALDHVQNPNRNKSQNNLHTFGRAELTASKAERMSAWK